LTDEQRSHDLALFISNYCLTTGKPINDVPITTFYKNYTKAFNIISRSVDTDFNEKF